MAPVIRISDMNWSRLKMWAEPLEDSTDDALGKALDAAEARRDDLALEDPNVQDQPGKGRSESTSPQIRGPVEPVEQRNKAADDIQEAHQMDIDRLPNTPTTRLSKGVGVPREAYRHTILEALYNCGGAASGRDVLEIVERKTEHLFGDVDYEFVNGKIPRWRKGAQWTRQQLVKEGLLKNNSPRGIWELTDQGVIEFKNKRG